MTSYFKNFFQDPKNESLVLFEDHHARYNLRSLKQEIIKIAQYISESDPQSVRWAICTENHYQFTACFFALIFLGKTPVILGHTQEKRAFEQQCDFDAIISDVDMPLLKEILIRYPQKDTITNEENAVSFFNREITNAPIIFFTSGSSGTPQKIQKDFRILEKESDILSQAFYKKLVNSHFITTVSPLHQYGFTFNILLPLRVKASNHISAISYQEELLNIPQSKLVTFITTPAFLKRLDLSLLPKCTFTNIFSAGGPLTEQDITETLQTFNCCLTEIYGSSESCVVAFRDFTPLKNKTLNTHLLFKPFPEITVTKTEDHLIKINSPLILSDYLILNDKIKLTNDGFMLLGRSDKIIKIEEERISLTEIERRIEELLPKSQAVIIPLTQGKRIILGAVIAIDKYDNLSSIELSNTISTALRQIISPIAIPRKWRFVQNIPTNSQGKITHELLKGLFND